MSDQRERRRPVVDLSDEEARRALVLKWGTVPVDVIPAWVAEMDYALDPVVREALLRAVRDGVTGYPEDGHTPALAEAYAGFAARHGSVVDPAWVMPAVALERGRVKLEPGHDYAPGLGGHVRLNLATSPSRLTEVVGRLASAWT